MIDVKKIEERLNNYSEHHKKFQLINYSEVKTIRDLLMMIISQKVKLPAIQRKEVWNNQIKSDFIGTLIVRPQNIANDLIPRITIVTDGVRWVLVDGQQRLITCLRFFKANSEIKEEIERYAEKFKRGFSLLNVNKDAAPLKLKFSENCILSKEDKETLSRFTCDKFPIDLQGLLLDLKFVINVVKVEEEDFEEKARELYLLLNNGVKVNKEETYRGRYQGTVLYDTIDDLSYNFLLPVVQYTDKRLKITNLLIDIYSMFIDEYTKGGSTGRNKILNKYKDDNESAKTFKEEFLNVLDVAKNIFPDGKCFSEYNVERGWKSLSFAATLPWTVAIRELLFEDTLLRKEDFIKNKDSIMELWKKLSIPTGKKKSAVDVVDNDKWLKYMVDHTNNKDRVLARKEIIKNLIIHAIK